MQVPVLVNISAGTPKRGPAYVHSLTVEPGYSEVHKSDGSFHYSYYFTIARVKYMCVVETVRPVASV